MECFVEFIPGSVWTLEGFDSCKEMKAASYERAKVGKLLINHILVTAFHSIGL